MAEPLNLTPRLVRASAGTGKTRELSSRYISLLAQGETPDKILATTFTRKAAGEIRERIFSRLSEAAQCNKKAAELGAEMEVATFSTAQASDLLQRLVTQQHRLLITTLDALFISMGQAFALELGLPVSWRIASEQDSESVRDLALKDLLDHGGTEGIQEILKLLQNGAVSRSVYRSFTDAVARLYPYYLATNRDAWEWLDPESNPPELSLEEIQASLTNYPIPSNKSGAPDKRIEKLVASLKLITKTKDWRKFTDMNLAMTALDGVYEYYNKPLEPELVKALDALVSHATLSSQIHLRNRLQGVRALLAVFDAAYRQAQRQRGVLTFDDVKHYLSTGSVTGELEPLYYRLDTRICHLLLDEFQDTSINEWRILEPIADEVLARPTERTFFCVGDMKQAIYGWRGGVAEIFGSIESRWEHLIPESKHTTYRCAPAIIDFVNDLFGSLPESTCLEHLQPAVHKWLERFHPHKAAKEEKAGCVAIHQASEESNPIEETVAIVSRLHKQHPQASIGVLVRRNKTVSELLARFTKSFPGMAVSEEGAVRITDSALVRGVLSLLTAIDHPGDTLANFHVVHSGLASHLDIPIIGKCIDQVWRSTAQSALLRAGYGAVLSGWSRTLAPLSGELDRQRLEQLVEQGYLFDEERTPRIVDFVSRIERTTVELPSQAQIRVMSLHKSKGLEFDIVVLPELDDAIDVKPHEILVGQDSPISPIEKIAIGAGTKFERKAIPQLGELWRVKQDALVVEALSLLYVGVTRPKQILHMILPADAKRPKTPKPSPAEILYERYGETLPSGILFGAVEVAIEEEDVEQVAVKAYTSQSLARSVATISTKKAPRLERISPSKLKNRRKLADPRLLKEGVYARERGTALHTLFEAIGWLEDFQFDTAVLSNLLPWLDPNRTNEILDEFKTLLASPMISDELSRARFSAASSVLLKREQGFAIKHESQLVSGVIDRLVVGYEDAQPVWAELLDFKSDKLEGHNAIEERVKRYSGQMSYYVRAVHSLLGCDIPVTAKLLFLDGPTIITVD